MRTLNTRNCITFTNPVEIVLSFIKSVNHLFRLNKKRESFIGNAKMTIKISNNDGLNGST